LLYVVIWTAVSALKAKERKREIVRERDIFDRKTKGGRIGGQREKEREGERERERERRARDERQRVRVKEQKC